MLICSSCGAENPEGFRFCGRCAAPLSAQEPGARELRKTVTVLFCDVTGSTALGERLDPESLRRVMARYFEAMKAVVERHGGTVEKFIGDAVMAVFGVPVLHEDDALRGVRAAAEMRQGVTALNEELERDYGTTLEVRIGVDTGEVVTGTKERLATGDAVNVAARLEQAASPSEVLLGEETFRLTREGVEVERVEPLDLKGKREPVTAFRLVAVLPDARVTARRADASMVGRERELDRLHDAFSQALRDRSCQLFTLLGVAGVGKSRLAHEFLAGLEDATVVQSRCLSYGEGITYWPVVGVLKQLLGVEPRARLVELGADELAAETILGVLGEAEAVGSTDEIAWAVRKLLEAAAADQPLVVVIDDVHWGEPALLDLIEHVADLSRDASMLLLCMGRPELLDRRPGWAGGKLNATTVLLEPLAASETDLLIDNLLAGARMETELRARISEAAEGNPLFVEEMITLLRESPAGEVVVPPTIQALLAARLDQLDAAERGVLECGSVEGRVFHQGAVHALAPNEQQLSTRLAALVRKELVRPDRTQIAGENAFRFRHLLIRDAAYDALPKAIRAELHESFAGWLEEHGRDLVELEEILGYHLEQAYRYRGELGPLTDEASAVGARAATYLALAGGKAYGRGDAPAAANLFTRAAAACPAGARTRLELLTELGQALFDAGNFTSAEAALNEAIETAEAAGDLALAARARVSRLALDTQIDPALDINRLQREAEGAIEQLEQAGDELGLARAWLLMVTVNNLHCQVAEMGECAKKALRYARSCGATREEADSLFWRAAAEVWGPLPADEGRRQCEQILADSRGRLLVEAAGRAGIAFADALQGRFEDARGQVAASRAIYKDLGQQLDYGATSILEGEVELLAGDAEAAERVLREGFELLESIGETAYLSTIASGLAEAIYLQKRYEEAERFSEVSEQTAAPGDLASQVGWRRTRATVLAQRGEAEQAEDLAREAVDIARRTDHLNMQASALLAFADVLAIEGRPAQAIPIIEEARVLYDRKGNVVMAEQARTLLAELGDAVASES
ncbi:MAG TPA: adenylate/guanylate cyclase domain-containing protein [Gaiellaceae bacterium]